MYKKDRSDLTGNSVIGNRVTKIRHGGIAYRAGLRVNDKVLSINGKPMHNADTIANTIKNAVGDVQLSVERD